MATQKPISTISYNTEGFLVEKLEEWRKAHIIQAYMYICHKGEDGDKDHIHVRIEPNKKLDPMNLAEDLREYQIGKEKPLGCRPFRPSKEEDWFLYAVHDAEYLRIKYGGGDKHEKLPYRWQDIKAPEDYDIETAFIRAKASLEHTASNMAKRIIQGESPMNIVLEGGNVFTANAVLRAASLCDYQRLQADYDALCNRYELLVKAVEDIGLTIDEDDSGNIIVRFDGFADVPTA